MLLVVDVGNTNITFGLYEGDDLTCQFRMTTQMSRTSDEFGIAMCELIRRNGKSEKDISGCIVASVVPKIMHALTGGIVKYLKVDPLIVGVGIKTGIKIITEAPKEIGPDRIVDAVGAYEKYGGPVLVLDFGTATTYDLITEKGEFAAGITAPGIAISAKALWEDTAKLPEVELRKPKSILAQETISSMQAGLIYGQIGQTEYIINQVRKEAGLTEMKVVATGGLGRIIADETDAIEVYDSTLTLDGLMYIYRRNRK